MSVSRYEGCHGRAPMRLALALAAITAAAAASDGGAVPPSPTLDQIEVCGYHGCWHTIAAIHAARKLKAEGLVDRVLVRRAGSQHAPRFADEDRAPFKAYTADMERTGVWDGQSPRVVIDGDAATAMGASPFIIMYASHLCGPSDFGLPPMREDLWRMALTEEALPLLAVAGLSRAHDFFTVDPPGAPLHNVVSADGLVTYDDIDASPTEYASHAMDMSADPELAAMLNKMAAKFGLDPVQS